MVVATASLAVSSLPSSLLVALSSSWENPAVASAFSQFANQCDLVYARDQVSFEAAKKVISSGNVQLAPDITIDSVKAPDHGMNPDLSRVCFVPNIRMTDKGDDPWKEEDYFEFFEKCAGQILEAGKSISIVVHEDKGADGQMAEQIANKIGRDNCSIYANSDPKELKNHIGSSRYVVGSRFHSLVAALSSNVPVISLGWAHKYEQLLADYLQSGFAYKEKQYTELCGNLLSELNDEQGLIRHKEILAQRNEEFRSRLGELWRDVAAKLGL